MTADAARHVARVLEGLRGHDLFRRNAFRVTGLPTDATQRQVRRAREESRNAYYVPPERPDAPLPPSSDETELRAAFEVLQDPVARLVHELLWADGAARDARADGVVRLCRALEGTARDGTVDEGAWADWSSGLAAWADGITSAATGELARRRVEAADDPRLTVGVGREARRQLAQHVVEVAAGIAARQVHTDPEATTRMVRTLRYAGFDAGTVPRALRAAARPLLEEVKQACDAAAAAPQHEGLAAARTLLDTTDEPLRLLDTLLGEDPLLDASRDDVGRQVNNVVVAYGNDHVDLIRRGRAPLDEIIALLSVARDLGGSATRALADDNLEVFVAARRRFGSRRERPARDAPVRAGTPGLVDRLDRGGMWAWLLALGPGPGLVGGLVVGLAGGSWFWGLAVPVFVAYLVARARCARRSWGGPWVIGIVTGAAAGTASVVGSLAPALLLAVFLVLVVAVTVGESS